MKFLQKKKPEYASKKTSHYIRKEIEQARSEMDNANKNFQNAIDPDLIDFYIYESNAAWKKYLFLLRQANLL